MTTRRNGEEPSRQVAHLYPDEVRAQAQALMLRGHSAEDIGQRLGVPARTVCHWRQRWREVAAETEHPEVINDWYRLTRRTQDKLHDGLDAIEDDETALKHLSQLTVLAGVGTDKIFRDREPKYGTGLRVVGPIVIVTHAQRPEIIEGEAVEVEEGVISPPPTP